MTFDVSGTVLRDCCLLGTNRPSQSRVRLAITHIEDALRVLPPDHEAEFDLSRALALLRGEEIYQE